MLVLDDNVELCDAIASELARAGCDVAAVYRGEDALAQIARSAPDVLVTDVQMPEMDGLTVFQRAREIDPALGVVMLTGYASVRGAVVAVQAGVDDYLAKPVRGAELLAVVRRVLERQRARASAAVAARPVRRSTPPAGLSGARPLLGTSVAMAALRERIALAGASRATVLVTGETGTGKERVAEALHAASGRAKGPFVAVNCAALTESLLESELFGHERGAFTGAVQRREGRFKLADHGTIFLDEIGEVSAAMQAKLLRVLQERRFERVGGTESLTVDVRVICATNRDLGQMVERGTFREDLYYRLNVVGIAVPPLRARAEDIPLLVKAQLERLDAESGTAPRAIEPEAMRMLVRYPWPGNVRELENVIERALLFANDGPITPALLLSELNPRTRHRSGDEPAVPGATFAEIERHAILATYEACGRNALRTAETLGLSPRTIHYRLREYAGAPGRRKIVTGS